MAPHLLRAFIEASVWRLLPTIDGLAAHAHRVWCCPGLFNILLSRSCPADAPAELPPSRGLILRVAKNYGVGKCSSMQILNRLP